MERTSKILEALANRSLLDLIPGLRDVMIEKGTVRWLDAGEPVASQGEPLHQLIIPIDRHLKLVKDRDAVTNTGQPALVGYLQKGRALCLRELLADEPMPYTAVTEEATSVVVVAKAFFMECLERRKNLPHYLRLMTASPAVRSLKEMLETWGVASERLIEAMALIPLEPVTVAAGTALDLSAPRLYLIDRGQVRLQPETAGAAPQTITEGAFFGGVAIVPPHRYFYQAVAVTPALVRAADLAAVAGLFQGTDVIERLFDEPWLTAAADTGAGAGPEITPLPGTRLPWSAVSPAAERLDPSTLDHAARDRDSVVATAVNVCRWLGAPVSRSNLTRELSAAPLSPLGLGAILESYGLMTAQVRRDPATPAEVATPAVIALGPRVVLLVEATRSHAVVLDPCRGVMALTVDELAAHWSGHALECHRPPEASAAAREPSPRGLPPTAGQPAAPEALWRRTVIGMLARYSRQYKSLLGNRLMIGLMLLAIGYLTPKVSQYLVDEALSLRDTGLIATLIVASFFLLAFNVLLSVANAILGAEFNYRLSGLVDQHYYRHRMSLPVSASAGSRVGTISSELGELNSVKGLAGEMPVTVLFQVLSLVFYAVVLVTYDFRLALIGLAVLPAILAVRLIFKRRMRANYLRLFELGREGQTLVTEQVTAMPAIKAASAEPLMRRKWEENNVAAATLRRRTGLEQSSIESGIGILTAIANGLALWVAVRAAGKGEMTIGEVIAATAYVSALMGPATQLAGFIPVWEKLRVSLERIGEVLTRSPGDSQEQAATQQSIALRGKIKLDRVGFRYSADGPWVLEDLNLTIFPNQVIAIVGRSGCGKTTLANLIAGSHQPTTGRVLYDDIDSRLITSTSRGAQIGFIMQENQLFAGSIGDNIAYGDDTPAETAVAAAATAASAHEFITAMPGGYAYYLTEGGLGLSGGQRQRLTIARTLYRNPRIMVMDESTSALDAESEAALIGRMKEILSGKTAIIVAHRLSTIRTADRILVMDAGRIVEEGTHSQLLQINGHYAQLFSSQMNMAS